MKFLLLAAFIAVAAASPARLIVPGPAGPAPVIDDDGSPISVGPVIIDDNESPISVGPVIVDESDYSSISVGPAIVEQPFAGSPLVQIIVNVKPGAAEAESPAVIDPSPVIVVDNDEVEPSPVIVVDNPEEKPSPVIVVDNPEEIIEQPIINAPVFPSPAIVLPDPLN